VLWPPAGEDSLDANEGSVGFLLDAGSFRYLNTGDASVEVEKRILEATVADSLRADVLKLGHHGSRTSSAVAWLRAVRPDIAVISAGRGNRYGHPHAVTLARLDSARVARVWRTDRDGPLCIEGDGRDWRIVDP
jgi:competence protein ComEC